MKEFVLKIFLCGCCSRRDLFRGIRSELKRLGYTVTSRWIDDDYSQKEDDCSEYKQDQLVKYIEDIKAADCLIAFTESSPSRGLGSRHVEFGFALALGIRLIVIGPRENVFYHHPSVEVFASHWDFFRTINEKARVHND